MTQESCNHRLFVQISTHTLTWSVTCQPFNRYCCCLISTHTLTWSVTTAEISALSPPSISTHTLTWSVTGGLITLWFFGRFQLTRSRGAWQQTIICNDLKQHFNSHAHVERDCYILRWWPIHWLFQLTRSRGAWPFYKHQVYPDRIISTHTLTWSVTPIIGCSTKEN